ncbi:MAG: O-antigen ligase family protein [Anaerolineae bacterium]
MRVHMERATLPSLLLATCLAVLMSTALARMSLPLALGLGLGLVALIVTIASNELGLYLLVFSMLLGPELIVGEIGQGTTLGRGVTLRLDDFLVVMVGVAWLAKTALYKELGLVFRTPLNQPIAVYAFAAFFATGLGVLMGRVHVVGGSLFLLKYVEYFIIYFMVVNNLRERRQFERFLLALLATAAIVSLIGILQIPSGQRVSAPFEGELGEPNTFGGYLVLMLSLVAGLYLRASQSLRQKVLMAGLAILISLPLLFTLSRASYLALIPMAGVLLAFSQRKLLVTGILVSGLILAPFLMPKPVVDRVLFTFTQGRSPQQFQIGGIRLDTSTSDRLRSWQEVLLVDWPEQPVFGYGVTGYHFLDAQYPRVLAETGLVGLLAFLWLQVSLFRQTRAVFKSARDPLFKGVALGFLAGFVAMVTHSLGANTFIIVRIMEPFWFLAGMVMMIPQLGASPAVREPLSEPLPVQEKRSLR